MPITAHFGAEAIPPWLNDLYKRLAEASEAQRLAAYQRYSGQRIASFSPMQQEALREASLRGGEYRPYINRAEQLLSGMNAPTHQNIAPYMSPYQRSKELIEGATTPSYAGIQQYMNPYQKEVIDKASSESLRNFREGILPEIENTFVRRGQHGSTRHRNVTLKASQQALQDVMANEAGMRNKHYLEAVNMRNADQGRALHGASLLGKNYQEAAAMRNADLMRAMQASGEMANLGSRLQGSNTANIGLLNSLGAQQQGRDQQLLNQSYEGFQNAVNYPSEQLQRQAALMHGIPYSSQISNIGQQPIQPQLDASGNIGALALGLHGMMNRGIGRKSGGSIPMRRR